MAQLSIPHESALADLDARIFAIFNRYAQRKKTAIWVFKWLGWLIFTGIGAILPLGVGFVLYLGAMFIFIDHLRALAAYRKLLPAETLLGHEMYRRTIAARDKAIGQLILWAVAMSLPVFFVVALFASHH